MIKAKRVEYKGTARKYIAEHNNINYVVYLNEFNCCCPVVVNEETEENITSSFLGTKIILACYNCQ